MPALDPRAPARALHAHPPSGMQPARRETPPSCVGPQLRALDLFCGAGGVAKGLQRAGFHVTGIDNRPQPRYCGDLFIQADALAPPVDLAGFDFIWASPPCQPFTSLRSVFDASKYRDLIEPTRALLASSGVMTALENVPGAPIRPDLVLCANAFGLRAYRHRLFELNFPAPFMMHPPHGERVNRRKINRRTHWDAGGFVTVTGDIGSYVGPKAMGIDWMNGNELSQAIPPAYAEYIGRAAIAHITPHALSASPSSASAMNSTSTTSARKRDSLGSRMEGL